MNIQYVSAKNNYSSGKYEIISQKIEVMGIDDDTYNRVIDCLWKKCEGRTGWHSGAKKLYKTQRTTDSLTQFESETDTKRYPQLRRIKAFWNQIEDNLPVFIFNLDHEHIVEKRVFTDQLRMLNTLGSEAAFSTRIWNYLYSKYSHQNLFYRYLSFGSDALDQNIGEVDKSKRICRFCGKTGKDNFKEKAHAIPEALGNCHLICYEECDACNHDFSHVEDSFIRLMDFRRAMYRIHHKGSSGCLNVNGENYCIQSDSEGYPLLYVFNADIPPYYDGHTPFSYCFRHNAKVTDANIYRALCKMLMDLMPSKELRHFEKTILWIKGETDAAFLPDYQFAYNPLPVFYEQPCLDVLFGMDDCKAPYCTGILYIYDVIYSWIMPMVDADEAFCQNEVGVREHWERLSSILHVQWHGNSSSGDSKVTPYVTEIIEPNKAHVFCVNSDHQVFEYLRPKSTENNDYIIFHKFDEKGISYVPQNMEYTGDCSYNGLRPIKYGHITITIHNASEKVHVSQRIGFGSVDSSVKTIAAYGDYRIEVTGLGKWYSLTEEPSPSFAADNVAFRKVVWHCLWLFWQKLVKEQFGFTDNETIHHFHFISFDDLLDMMRNVRFLIYLRNQSRPVSIKAQSLWYA